MDIRSSGLQHQRLTFNVSNASASGPLFREWNGWMRTLAHGDPDKMTALNFVDGFFRFMFLSENYWTLFRFQWDLFPRVYLTITHWGRVTHICVGRITISGSDNGLSPGRRQAIIWTNAAILSIGSLGTNFSEISIEIHTFSLKKMHLKMSSAKWRLFWLGLNVISQHWFWWWPGA